MNTPKEPTSWPEAVGIMVCIALILGFTAFVVWVLAGC